MATSQSIAYAAVEDALFSRAGGDDAFNPYYDRNADVDRPDAVAIRRDNLQRYFGACPSRPELFLLAEAPGPWGCRFSGVPITSEAQLLDPEFPLTGRQSSLRETPHSEYSANIFWRLLSEHLSRFVVWNAYPLHPHRPGEPFSIRTPRRSELGAFVGLVARLVDIFQPETVLAVGRKAQAALTDCGVACHYVRHPSQGGAALFRSGVQEALSTT